MYQNYIEIFDEDKVDEDLTIAIKESLENSVRNDASLNLEDFLPTIQETFQEEGSCTIIVNRKRVLRSTIQAISQPGFSFKKEPCVEFSGDRAEDYRGPRQEFFRLYT